MLEPWAQISERLRRYSNCIIYSALFKLHHLLGVIQTALLLGVVQTALLLCLRAGALEI